MTKDKLKFVKSSDGLHEAYVEKHDITYAIEQGDDGDWTASRDDDEIESGLTFKEAKDAAQADFDAYEEGNDEVADLLESDENDDSKDDDLGQVAEVRDGADDSRTTEEAQEDAQIAKTEIDAEKAVAPKNVAVKVPKADTSDKAEYTATFSNGETRSFHSVDVKSARYRAYRIARDTAWKVVQTDDKGNAIGVKVSTIVDSSGAEIK